MIRFTITMPLHHDVRAAIAERDAEADRPTAAAEQEAATSSQ